MFFDLFKNFVHLHSQLHISYIGGLSRNLWFSETTIEEFRFGTYNE
jgi:hypothetical protein